MTMRLLFTLMLLVGALPAWAQVPNGHATIQRLAAEHPAAFACAHTPAGCAHDFIKLVACDLHAQDARFGLNGKRGNAGDLSWDAINWCGGGPGHDPTGACRGGLTVVDVIGSAGSPAAHPIWLPFVDLPGPGAWVQPTNCGSAPTPPPTPPTPVPTNPAPAPVDLGPVLAQLSQLSQQLAALEAQLAEVDAHLGRVEATVHYGAQQTLEVKQLLLNPPIYKGGLIGLPLTLRPERP